MLALYNRIFQARNFRILIWVAMGIVSAYGLAFLLVFALQCKPPSYSWLDWSQGTELECLNIADMSWAMAAFNIFLDIVVIVIPIPQLLSLQLSWRKKLQVTALFCLGFL